MPPGVVLAALVRGLELLGLAVVIGGLALELVLPSAADPELLAARRRLHRWISSALVVLLAATLVELLVRTQAMSRVPLGGAVGAIPDVLARTHFGAIWVVRAIALGLALLLSRARGAALRRLCALVAVGVALTISLTGHAAEWGDVTLAVATDWIHTVAASAWTGGLIALPLVVLRRDRPWPPPLLGTLARRFSRLAGLCVLAVVGTGVYNAWAQLGAVSALQRTTYGRVLGLKLLLVAAVVSLGAVNRYVVVPSLLPAGAARGVGARLVRVSRLIVRGRSRLARAMAPARLSTYLAGEALLAVGVFACTTALGEATPGRHALIQRRLTTHVSAKDLRQSRDVERGGSVTPPAGDRARGDATFARLRCFDCHAVRQARFPAPTRPGPDLSGAARHHPGYLVESILNPDAMVVDGPGYAGEAGRSTMPDYRRQLTVGELIDLVAYLKGLDDRR